MFSSLKNFLKEYYKVFILIFLFLIFTFIWSNAFSLKNKNLKVVFLDIGQGDSIFIESPVGNQVLFDGGAGDTLIRVLPKYMSFFDRDLDMIVVTNPDKDHFEGFISLLSKYKVPVILTSGVEANQNPLYIELLKKVDENKMKNITGRRGQRIDLGGGVFIDIIFPDRDVSSLGHNDGSLVAKLVYGETSFLLTGDTTENMEKYFVEKYEDSIKANILKVAHHGSKTSTSKVFVEAVSPEMAIISAGKDNSYGHPHKEVLDILEKEKIPVLGTYDEGSIFLESDGKKIWRK